MTKAYYEKKQKEAAQTAEKLARQSAVWGRLRLLLILLVLGLLTYGFFNGYQPLLLGSSAIFLLLNLTLWTVQARTSQRLSHVSGIRDLAGMQLKRMAGEFTAFPDSGLDFASEDHPYAADLDLFGSGSLFQLLNLSRSYHGRQAFAQDLKGHAYTPTQIQIRQQAVLELAELRDFSLDYQYHSSLLKAPSQILKLTALMKESPLFLPDGLLKNALFYGPAVLSPAALALLLLGSAGVVKAAGLVILLLQTFLWLFFFVKSNRYLVFSSQAENSLKPYSQLFSLLESQEFEAPLLNQLKSELTKGEHSAAKAIKELNGIVNRTDFRHSTILYFLLNILFLWDIHCAFLLEKWRNRYICYFAGWFTALGVFESLHSFSVLPNVTDDLTVPVVMETPRQQGREILAAEGLGHPLIHSALRVVNDFRLPGSITILSGSNMSGKTTFMRTLALNLVLAQAGSLVCAGKFSFRPVTIVTSMRITDDLGQGASTFYAELKKIRRIMDTAEKEQNCVFFIDEIFRGTNSEDRIGGAKQVIAKLSRLGACGVLTTHDLALCREDGGIPQGTVSNWHFSEQYQAEGLFFDYKLRPGVAESTNGRYLMKLLGIID